MREAQGQLFKETESELNGERNFANLTNLYATSTAFTEISTLSL